jgi:hypothetical protein
MKIKNNNLLYNYFSSVYSDDLGEQPPLLEKRTNEIFDMNKNDFSIKTVEKELEKLNEFKTPGPDNVSPFV